MSKTRVCVIGAAGRMGRRLVALIMESNDAYSPVWMCMGCGCVSVCLCVYPTVLL